MEYSQMIDNLRNGKESGLIAVYNLYKRSLLYFSSQFVDRETSEEIVSDIFVKVWRLRKDFETEQKLKAFLYISTKNACFNHLRKPQTRWNMEDISSWNDILFEDAEVYTKIVQAELLEQIHREVAKLSPKQREVFNMTYLEDMTVEEIGKKLRISPTAVYVHRTRMIAFLRNSIKIKDALYILFFVLAF